MTLKLALFAFLTLFAPTQQPQNRTPDDYKLGPDSQYQEGVPRGEVTHYTWTSKIFPGTVRDYWVYVPKQYDPATPACVMIFQDGGGFQSPQGGARVPVVFDNLIHRKEMPVTIAIMINPGVLPAASPNALPRYNRSYEYDNLSDEYARFLLDEILPEVGKKYNLTKDPNGRGLCGSSSGGICSFVTAWERPDQFRRVISFIGSFTNLRGGHNYAALIRKTEPKPLRVFQQDGSNDQDIYSGSWFLGNQDVAAALKFARYDHQFVIGDGYHSGKHGASILPDALRWLWRDYPTPIKAATATPQPIMEVVAPGEDWQPLPEATGVKALAADSSGTLFFADASRLRKRDPDGRITVVREQAEGITALAFAPDGRLYASQPAKKRVVVYNLKDTKGTETVALKDFAAASLVVSRKGDLYASETGTGKVWLVREGKKTLVDIGMPGNTTLALTPDQSLLLLAEEKQHFILSYQCQSDGMLTARQPYFDLHIKYGTDTSGAGGMTTDTQGRLYVTSLEGVQVLDQAGRVNGILTNPERVPTTRITFGGANLDTLCVAAGGQVYLRKTKVKGVLSFLDPIKPPGPRL